MSCIKIAYLYPDILNLHGDRGNIMALERIGHLMGLKVQVDRFDDVHETIPFESYDMVLMSPGELKVMPIIAAELTRQKEAVARFIQDGKFWFVIGTTAAVFAHHVQRLDGSHFKGLGYGNFDVEEREMVYGDDLIFNCNLAGEKMEIVGNQIQMIDLITPKLYAENAFGQLEYGHGNCGIGREGIKEKNLIITNTLGPLFVKNPWLGEAVFKEILQYKGMDFDIKPLDFTLEKQSNQAIIKFNQIKQD